jgi:hypothetical protein
MFSGLASWGVVGIAFTLLVGFGIALTLAMGGGGVNLPYETALARLCFSVGFFILLIRAGWWLTFEQPSRTSWLPLLVGAAIIFGSIGCLWIASMKWVTEREHQKLAQQPITTIKESTKPINKSKSELSPPSMENFRYVEERTPSPKAKFPYGLRVIIQSTITLQSVYFEIECDGEINDVLLPQGVSIENESGISTEKNSVVIIKFTPIPPIQPEKPLVIILLSKADIRVIQIRKIFQ